jgi:3-vinyl bacteriochlorophyllide hydratase
VRQPIASFQLGKTAARGCLVKSPGDRNSGHALYTPEQRLRRDASGWTLVQGLLAPFQFLVFLISLALVIRYLWTGVGYEAATLSILGKTVTLYIIMITGAIWEKVVFGQYLFAPSFYWEDMVSMVVIALHTLYLVGHVSGWFSPQTEMLIALAAYTTYVLNAAQFILKLRRARLDAGSPSISGGQTA